MISETAWRRILYLATGLVIMVILILVFFVIPHIRLDTSPHATPETAISGTFIVAGIHLFIIVLLIYSVMFSFREGHFENGFLITAGVLVILLSLMIIDGAIAYLGHPDLHSTSISMFICVGFDFIAGILSFTARYFRGHLKAIN
jgi:magnesium-transporting ATPase (P-type)